MVIPELYVLQDLISGGCGLPVCGQNSKDKDIKNYGFASFLWV